MAAPVTVPNDFSANTPSSASEVNANFDALAVGINDNDSRINDVLATNPTPSRAGVSAYVTTTSPSAAIGSSFNSTGGAVTIVGSGGSCTATFAGITCVSTAGDLLGIATVVPYAGSLARTCRVRDLTQVGADCTIDVDCFATEALGLIGGALAIDYRQ